jgi:hypothetical protein
MQKDKIRDMVRSILPSRAARNARSSKSLANRRNRHAVRQSLHQFKKEEWENNEDELTVRINDSDGNRRRDIRMMVSERRGADKIRHFVRWCERKTRHISEDNPQERYFYISGLIGGPSDLIREHALGHFLDPEYHFNVVARESYRGYRRYQTPAPLLFSRDAFVKALQWTYEHCPAHLNRALKSAGEVGPYRAPLLKWRACKPEKDDCVFTRVAEVKLYSYQTPRYHALQRETRYKPAEGDYRPGTLNCRVEREETQEHDDRSCENKIIVHCQEDLDRIVTRIFGDSTEYRAYNYRQHQSLTQRLVKLFISKNLLEDRGPLIGQV